MHRAAMIFVAFALAGCSPGIQYLSQNYGDPSLKMIPVATEDGSFNIVEKPEQRKVLVQRSLGDAMAQGFSGGLILNPTATAMPRPYYEKAALTYFSNGGRQCQVTDGFLVVEPTWEFTYACDVVTGAVAVKSPKGKR